VIFRSIAPLSLPLSRERERDVSLFTVWADFEITLLQTAQEEREFHSFIFHWDNCSCLLFLILAVTFLRESASNIFLTCIQLTFLSLEVENKVLVILSLLLVSVLLHTNVFLEFYSKWFKKKKHKQISGKLNDISVYNCSYILDSFCCMKAVFFYIFFF
jgi:hypothetical protein